MITKTLNSLWFGCVLLLAGPVSAHTFSFEVGGDYGLKAESDVERARKQDFSVDEAGSLFSTGKVFTSSEAPGKFRPEPTLGLSATFDMGELGLLISARHAQHTSTYDYETMKLPASLPGFPGSMLISGVGQTLQQREKNSDLEMGLRIPFLDHRLTLTPRLGYRASQLDVSGSQTASDLALVSGASAGTIRVEDASMNGTARGFFAGLNADWRLSKGIEAYVSATHIPGLSGNMRWSDGLHATDATVTIAGKTITGNSIAISADTNSGYRIRGSILEGGMKFYFGDTVFLRLGYRDEIALVSYPGYVSVNPNVGFGTYLGFPVSSGNAYLVEPVTNAILYGKEHQRRWSGISLAVGGNFDFGK